MKRSTVYLNELIHEAENTRKLLKAVPSDKMEWQPHEKSMTMWQLAGHIAEMYSWVADTLNTSELDMAKIDYMPFKAENNEELLAKFEETLAAAKTALDGKEDSFMMEEWTMYQGEKELFKMPRIAVLRNMLYNHLYHHRGQLTVYLRLVDAFVPGTYGPTADEIAQMKKAKTIQ